MTRSFRRSASNCAINALFAYAPIFGILKISATLVILVILVILLILGHARTAEAYVRARTTDTYVPIFWADPRKVLEIARPPDGVGVSTDDLRGAAQAALASWSSSAIACTGVSLRLATAATDSQVAGRDDRNRIVMRTGSWCRDPLAMTHCHDPAAVALTTVFTRSNPNGPDDGEILEADIEVNATGDFQWGVIPDGVVSGRDFANIYDLTSALTHETGHFIGLDHTCATPNAPLLIDDGGIAVPLCSSIPADQDAVILDATMFPFMDPSVVTLRSLSPDDEKAACDIYPRWASPVDEWVGGGGCAQAPSPVSRDPRSPILVAVALAIAAWLRRPARHRQNAAGARSRAPTPRNPWLLGAFRRVVVRPATPRND